jgi:hypothetical protein
MPPESSRRYASIQAELEQVRAKFLQMLHQISGVDWDRPVPGEGWTARQELAHVTQVLQRLPVGVRRATTGRRRSVLNIVPERLRRWANGYIIVPVTYRTATRASLAASYEQAHTTLLQVPREVPEEAWDQGAHYPREYRTVEQMAHRPAEHCAEHAAHLRRVLGMPPGDRQAQA